LWDHHEKSVPQCCHSFNRSRKNLSILVISAVPSGLPRATQSFPSPSKTQFGQVWLKVAQYEVLGRLEKQAKSR